MHYKHPGLVVDSDVPARMHDGTVLYGDVYRPAGPGRWPVLLMRTPYNKTKALQTHYDHPTWLAQQGYVVVVQDVRGCFSSEGVFRPFVDEERDGYDTVEWAADLPGANGEVAMIGHSYAGAVQLHAALRKPPSLRAVCPALTASRYDEGWAYRGGAFSLAFNAYWATHLAMGAARRERDSSRIARLKSAYVGDAACLEHLPLSSYPPLNGHDQGKLFLEWLTNPSHTDYWAQQGVHERYGDIAVPGLHIGGWFDAFISGTIANYRGLRTGSASPGSRADQFTLIGPWWHAGWTRNVGQVDFGPEAGLSVNAWQLAWLNHFMKGEDTDVTNSPATVFLMGRNKWLRLPDWPPPPSLLLNLHLHSDGSARTIGGALEERPPDPSPPDIFVYDPLFPVPSVGGHSCGVPGTAPMGPARQNAVEALDVVLTYTARPQERELIVMGEVTVTIFAATSGTDTDFAVKLCDIAPDGSSYNVLEGILRARYRSALGIGELLTPGEVYEFLIALGPVAHSFKPDHRVRLQLTSSDFPQWDRNLNTGGPPGLEEVAQARVVTQLVFHEPGRESRLSLPIVDL